jgi:ABC-type nitrate/sulfonate/bicarbonate transport system permease component
VTLKKLVWNLAPLAVLAAGLAVWEIWVRAADTPAWLLPPPSKVAETLWSQRGALTHHAWVTLKEVLVGFGVALIVGVALAVVIDASRIASRALYPLVIASQTIPVIALAPLLLTWFGYGLTPKVIVIALIVFFPIVVNTVDGLAGADREQLDLLRAFGAGRWRRFWIVKAPGAVPMLFSGARIGVAVSVIGAVFGEFSGSRDGLGYLIRISNSQQRTALVFAAIVALSALALALFGAVAAIERVCLPWRRTVTETDEAKTE